MKRIMFLMVLSLMVISLLLVSCGTGQAYARYGCGNGVTDEKEECDDGNGVDTDSCSNTCVVQQPDLEVQCKNDADCPGTGEVCNSGQCVAGTPKTYCGDGNVDEMTEECDDGNSVDDDACSNSCINAYCGDGQVQAPNGDGQTEQCDDGNTVNNDGCSNTCVVQKPDLVVSSAEFSLVLNQSTGKNEIKYNATIKNIGTAATAAPPIAGTSYTKFFADFGSGSGVPSANQHNGVPPLQVGQSVSVVGTYSPYSATGNEQSGYVVGNSACPGTHTLNITADYINQVAESNEANNGYQLNVTC